MQRVIVIGAGLGGLECAYILAKNGLQVTVLEQDAHIGGCLQTFRRGEVLFDSGFHYVGGLREGESLYPLFRYFGLLDLPWQLLDEEAFDEVVIGGQSYPFAMGHERFVESLLPYFPQAKEELQRYVAVLRHTGEHIADAFMPHDSTDYIASSALSRSAYEFLCQTISDPLLRRVLSGTSIKMELNADTLPLYVFAQINNSFMQSAWRLRGGGQQITDRLASSVVRMGGEVRTQTLVTAIEQRSDATLVHTANGDTYEADWVICNIHPVSAVRLMSGNAAIKPVYQHRLERLQNTFGMFTANIRLKPDALPYINHNLFVHSGDADLWNPDTSVPQSVMVSFYAGQPAVDLLTPMRWQQVERWADTKAGRRGDDYVGMKRQVVEDCLRLVERRLPDLRGAIDRVYTSTPLTYCRFTLTPYGSAYGIRKDWRSPLTTVLSPRTPLPRVLLTGQNLTLHGILGVSMTSVLTAAEILGMPAILQQIKY